MTNPPPGDPARQTPPDPNWQTPPDANAPVPPPEAGWQGPPPGDPGWQQPPPPGAGWPAGPPLVAPAPKSSHMWVVIPIAAVVLLLVGGGVWAALALRGDDGGGKGEQSQVAEPKAETADGGIVLGGGEPEIEIYLDFICPACSSFQTQNEQLMSQAIADESATFVFHPLNFLPKASTTDYSLRAASASVCAADEGEFFEYYSILMRNQPPEGGSGLDDDKLRDYGTELGLGDGFADCVSDGRYRDWIDRATDKALDSGVNSTPTIRIDGEKVDAQDFATAFADKVK